MKRVVNMRLLADGTWRACIHWLVEGAGPIKMEGHPQLRAAAKMPTQVTGHIACNPAQNSLNPQTRNGEICLCLNSNDLRAVSCPKCRETPEAIAELERLERGENGMDEKGRKAVEEAEASHAKAVAMQGAA